jgi:hypothetical protein
MAMLAKPLYACSTFLIFFNCGSERRCLFFVDVGEGKKEKLVVAQYY